MTTSRTYSLVALCVAVFAGSFAGTIVARSQSSSPVETAAASPLARWLDLDKQAEEEIESHDQGFTDDLKSLRQGLADARSALATLLDAGDATDDQIRERVDECIRAHNALERRITDYVLTVRDHLTPAQQKRLFHLCAEGVRKGRAYGWGRGRGGGERCECCGRGGGGGRRHGRGHSDE